MATYVIYADTADAYINSSSTTYSTARSGGGTISANNTNFGMYVGQYFSSPTSYVYEHFLSFDTSSVANTPISVTLSVYSQSTDGATFTINARAYDWGSSVTTADFVAGASLSALPLRASRSTASWPLEQYLDFTTDSSFLTNTANPVRLVLASSLTEAGTAPSAPESVSMYPADNTGTTKDPKLTIVTALIKTTSDSWAWSDSVPEPTGGPFGRARAAVGNTWAWSDATSVYWRAQRQPVLVRSEGANTTLNGSQSASSGTITVVSTGGGAGFPSSGIAAIVDTATPPYAQTTFSYTGITGTTFTGCTGGSGTFPSGAVVATLDAENHFPQVTPLTDTARPPFLVSYTQHPGHSGKNGALKGKKSIDGGLSWGSELTLRSAPVNGSTFGIFGHTLARLLNGRLLMMWYEHDLTSGMSRSYLSRSDDDGVTWSTPTRLSSPSGYDTDGTAVGFATYLDTGSGSNSTYGDLYVTAYGVATGGVFGTDAFSKMMKITDGGVAGDWTFVGTIATRAQTAGYQNGEPSITVLPSGTWLSQLRVESPGLNRWQCTSTDKGATWTGHAQVIANIGNSAVTHLMPESHIISQGQDLAHSLQTISYLSLDGGATWPSTFYRGEATDATYSVGNGSDFATIADTSLPARRVVNAFSQERSNQGGAQVKFQWYAVPNFPLVYDYWAWSDTATGRITASSKTTADAWAWSDSVARTPSKGRTTSDVWAWSNTVSTAGQARSTGDIWAWADVAVQRHSLRVTTGDTWAWVSTAAGSVTPISAVWSRTTADTWSWSDTAVGSAVIPGNTTTRDTYASFEGVSLTTAVFVSPTSTAAFDRTTRLPDEPGELFSGGSSGSPSSDILDGGSPDTAPSGGYDGGGP